LEKRDERLGLLRQQSDSLLERRFGGGLIEGFCAFGRRDEGASRGLERDKVGCCPYDFSRCRPDHLADILTLLLRLSVERKQSIEPLFTQRLQSPDEARCRVIQRLQQSAPLDFVEKLCRRYGALHPGVLQEVLAALRRSQSPGGR